MKGTGRVRPQSKSQPSAFGSRSSLRVRGGFRQLGGGTRAEKYAKLEKAQADPALTRELGSILAKGAARQE
jgi:hypothetical protein